MISIYNSFRVKEIEQKYGHDLKTLFYNWHWKDNLKHGEIGERISVPRPTVTRWFKKFKIPTQSATRFTNLNLLNVGPRKGPRAKPKVKKEFPWKFDKDFFKKWSSEMAYVLGFLAADGYVYKNPRGSCYVCFCSTDREILEKIKLVLKSNHTIGIRNKKLKNKFWKNLYVLQIGSKEVVSHLKKFGIVQNKSLIIKFPKIPPKLLNHFVRGYFDGDGGVSFINSFRKDRDRYYKNLLTSFTSGSKEFLVGLHKSLNKYIQGGSLSGGKDCFHLSFSKNSSIALFKFMYNNIDSNLFLERKFNTFKEAFKFYNLRA